MKFQYINNACTLIKGDQVKILFDPWIYGVLYNGNWHPEKKAKNFDPNVLSNISHIFISHLHQDHWDLDTLKFINKDALILLPDFPFNKVIMMSLKKNGFKKFKFLKINKYFSISKNISIKVIPQLNDFGQEISEYESNPSNPYVSFDTGLLIKDAINDQYHALLGDNTPYNIKQFSKCIGNNDLHSLWFPFNGFAHDYPLTYENIPTKSKVKISEQSCQKRNDLLLDVYEHLKPKFLIPHSADFRLTGKKSILFRQVHNKKFRSRFLYSKWLLNTFKLPAIYLGVGDEITFSDYDQSYKINKSLNIRSQRTLPIKSTKSQTYFQSLNSNDLRSALSKMNSRCNQYGLNFKDFHDWIFAIDLSDSKRTYFIDFSKKSITKRLDNNCKKKRLTLKISSSKLNKILLREDHLNNCIIGHELKWERQPNVYNQHLYNALNFFHL